MKKFAKKFNLKGIRLVGFVLFTLISLLSLILLSRTVIYCSNVTSDYVSVTAVVNSVDYDSGKSFDIFNIYSQKIQISYEYDGTTYNDVVVTGSLKPVIKGNNITVYITAKDSKNPLTDAIWFPVMFTAPILIIFLALDFILLSSHSKRIKARNAKLEHLKSNGDILQATIKKVNDNNFDFVNFKRVYNIECTAIEENGTDMLYFKSENHVDLKDALVGDAVNVYIDKLHKNNYYVDISAYTTQGVN